MAKQILIKDSKLKDLKPDPDNPRTISEEKLNSLRKSLEEFGDLSCIVYNELEDKLVGAHQRLKVFSSSSKIVITDKYKKPNKQGTIREGYVLIDGEKFKYRVVRWTKEKHKAAMLAANKHSGEWDQKKLAEIVESLKESSLDFGLTGFDFGDFPRIFPEESKKGLVDDDFVPEPKKTNIKIGDIFELGDHRLMCGDSTDKETVEKLMNGEKADMVFTDPPYELITKGGGLLKESRAMREISKLGIDKFNPESLILHSETNVFCCNKPLIKKYIELAEKNDVSWDLAVYHKQNITPNYGGHLMTDLEYLLVVGKQSPRTGINEDKSLYSKLYSGGKDQDNETAWSKPVALCEKFIKLYSTKSVMDYFGGSGSTLIACEKTNRKCFMMELDPHYCQVIIDRWEAYTGRKAVKVSK